MIGMRIKILVANLLLIINCSYVSSLVIQILTINALIDLMNELDTNYRIVLPSDGKYGGRSNQNFRWNGMIGLVLENVSLSL